MTLCWFFKFYFLIPEKEMEMFFFAETCGTPEYISPELLLRVPYTDKVDMWAVGVIAYILMSGIMPFDDDCRSRLYTHIITANYVYFPQVRNFFVAFKIKKKIMFQK